MSPPAHRNPYPGPCVPCRASSHRALGQARAPESLPRDRRETPSLRATVYARALTRDRPGRTAGRSSPSPQAAVRACRGLYPGPPARARPRPFGYGSGQAARAYPAGVRADSSGRRARRMRLVGMCAGGALVTCLIVMAVGLLGGPGALSFIPWDGHHGSGSADTSSAGRARTSGPGVPLRPIMPASGRSGATRGGSSSPSGVSLGFAVGGPEPVTGRDEPGRQEATGPQPHADAVPWDLTRQSRPTNPGTGPPGRPAVTGLWWACCWWSSRWAWR